MNSPAQAHGTFFAFIPRNTSLSGTDVIAAGNYSSLYGLEERPDARVYVQLKQLAGVELIRMRSLTTGEENPPPPPFARPPKSNVWTTAHGERGARKIGSAMEGGRAEA